MNYRGVVGKSKEKEPLGYIGVEGMIIIKWILSMF